MKKLLYIAVLSALFLSGCEKKSADFAPESLFEMSGDSTAAGIMPGDDSEAFIKAYSGYTTQVAYLDDGSQYAAMPIEKIPYGDHISVLIATLFIDGEPVSEEKLCRDNDWEPDALHSHLSTPAYLRRHEVIYRYLSFTWKDSVITDITSEELNYNETFETPLQEN